MFSLLSFNEIGGCSMTTINENIFWKKKEFISFVLSLLVFCIHMSSIAQYPNTGDIISIVNEKFAFFFKESITRFAVPMFFMLSGMVFFKDYDNNKYINKIKSRLFTIVIPYLLWNTIWMIYDIICSYAYPFKNFVGREPFALDFINILKGVFFYECNAPFWYIFDLIIFSLAAPLINFIIRNKYIGIASVVVLTILATFGIGIPESVFFTQTSIIYYLIGAIIGKHFFDFASRKSKKSVARFSLVFLIAYIILKNIFATRTYPLETLLKVVFYTLSAFALWNLTDMFIHKVKPKKIYCRSFAIYATHINISAVISKLLFLCLPKNNWMAIPNFIITFILTLILINLICIFLEKFMPRVYSILMGSRLRKSNTR